MLDWLGCDCDFPSGALDDFGHGLSPVQYLSCLLVLIDIDSNLVYQLLVDLLILNNQSQKPVDLSIETFVLVQISKMVSSELLLLSNYDIEFALLSTNSSFDLILFFSKLFSSAELVV